jgi:hypothetical protein
MFAVEAPGWRGAMLGVLRFESMALPRARK